MKGISGIVGAVTVALLLSAACESRQDVCFEKMDSPREYDTSAEALFGGMCETFLMYDAGTPTGDPNKQRFHDYALVSCAARYQYDRKCRSEPRYIPDPSRTGF